MRSVSLRNSPLLYLPPCLLGSAWHLFFMSRYHFIQRTNTIRLIDQNSDPVMSAVDNLLHGLVEGKKAPSVQYIIFDRKQIIHHFIDGLADIKNKQKITELTTYHAYSVTKTFTAAAILQLAEKGKLQIDEPVKKYFPEFPYNTAITVRHLLTHTAGIPSPLPLSWIHLPKDHASFDRDQYFNAVFLRHNRTQCSPNEKFSYSNLGYVLLGQLIEKMTGISYEQYITENVLQPLGLSSHELGFSITGSGTLAKGYHQRFSFSNALLSFLIDKAAFMDKAEGNWKPFRDFYVNGAAYGGLMGSVMAFTRYLRELLQPNSKLLSDTYKKMLFVENHTAAGKKTGMCLSWFCGTLKGNKYFTHAGGGGGYYCELRIYPGLNIGSIVMFNRTGMSDERFLDKPDSYFIHAI